MKKFRKALSAVSAALLCAVPIVNGTVVNAAENENKYYATYVLYHDVQNANIAYFDFSISYDSSVIAEPSMKTALCGTNSFNSIHYTTSHKIQTTYSGNAFGKTGTAATTKLLAPLYSSNIYDLISYSNPVIKNAGGSNMSPTSITLDAVLLGDVDGSGYVNVADLSYIAKHFVDPSSYPLKDYRTADVNLDGMITEEDKDILLKYVSESIGHF